MQGDLVESAYIDTIAAETNEFLLEAGQVSIAELCKRFNLPSEFLMAQFERRVGSLIRGRLDVTGGTIVTDAFIARQTATICGVFSAITRPTPIGALIARYNLPAKLFRSILDQLIESRRLAGQLRGRGERLEYEPNIQRQTQDRFIESFYAENGYIEYDSLARLEVKNPKASCKSRFKGGTALDTCYVNATIVETVNGSIEEALASGEWLNVLSLLPSPCTAADASFLLDRCRSLTKVKSARVFCDVIVCSSEFVVKSATFFDDAMEERAKVITTATKKNAAVERNKVSGGGTPNSSGSEPTKKEKRDQRKAKKGAKRDVDSGVGAAGAEVEGNWNFLTVYEVGKILQEKLPECDESFLNELAIVLHRRLSDAFQMKVRDMFLAGSGTGGDRRKETARLAKEFSNLYAYAFMYSKGISSFKEDVVAFPLLTRHLLRDLGQQMLEIVVRIKAAEHCVQIDAEADKALTDNVRAAIIAQFPVVDRILLEKLSSAVEGKDSEVALELLGDAIEECGLQLTRTSKKQERELLYQQRHQLSEQLKGCKDPATTLLIVTSLIFQKCTGSLIHAQGRFVPHLVKFLALHTTAEEHAVLTEFQKSVQAAMVGDAEAPQDQDLEKVKALILAPKEEAGKQDVPGDRMPASAQATNSVDEDASEAEAAAFRRQVDAAATASSTEKTTKPKRRRMKAST